MICEDIFSVESVRELGIPPFKLGQLPFGFTNDIACVGNDWVVGVSLILTSGITCSLPVST